MPRWARYAALVLLGLGLVLLFLAARPRERAHHARRAQPALATTLQYSRDVKPILEARCYGCHGPVRHKAGLRLDTPGLIRRGGDSGTVIVPGDSANSLLIAMVRGAEDRGRMPPIGEPLSAEQIALLKAWIDAGAPAPYDDEPETREDDHWAFRPPALPPVPAVHNSGWARNPIDSLLVAEQKKRGLAPGPPVARGLLLRRVYLDLVGLPPTGEELHAFLADPSENAYEKVVDRLLASPQYGERWGRHWMDVWRYSDPDGRKSKKDTWWSNEHIWRWREWIVQSLNRDKGYDRMVVEMLAGDEVAPGDPEALAATGFLVRNWFKLSRNIWLNNTVEHTAKAFLGLTINCARCHDHKFDPISQEEYYRFRAFFEPHDIRTDYLPAGRNVCPTTATVGQTFLSASVATAAVGQTFLSGTAATAAVGQTFLSGTAAITHAYDAHPEAPTWILVRGDEGSPDKATLITPGVPEALGRTANEEAKGEKGKAKARREMLSPLPFPLSPTARRLALARWICDRQNPLAARVAVNHVWARHFGKPLVENVYDFGLRSKPPAQQPLLDWLAVELMAHDWSMKWLHRLMVTCAAYRMQCSSGGVSAEYLALDPDNQYYWRMNARRMEAEIMRDALLRLSGELDLTMGGPPLGFTASGGRQPPDGSPRRSLYHRYSREDKMEFLTVFDAASVDDCYRRQESIVPQQALALENSEFVWNQAQRIAHRLDKASVSARAFVTAAFEHVLGRAPGPTELEACECFLSRQEELLADRSRLTAFPAGPLAKVGPAVDPRGQARESLVHALLNHNDFITIR